MNLYTVRLTRRVLGEPSKDEVAPIEATMSLDDRRGPRGAFPGEIKMRMPRSIFGGSAVGVAHRLEAKMYYVLRQSPAHALDMAQRHFGVVADFATVIKVGDGDGEPKIVASSDQDESSLVPMAIAG